MTRHIIIFDTTLRDGEQALTASLSIKQKLMIAQALERLGVDIMEVGFPVSSPGDFQSVTTIAKQIKNSRVCALARALEKDIDAAAEALKPAKDFRIHTFISTSRIHVENKLKRTFDEVLEMGTQAIKYARRFTDDVEFSCEDAGRTPMDHLCRMVERAIAAGATTVNIPDTVGYTLPDEFKTIIQTLFNRVPNIDQAVISVHCHDDLGMSVGNSLSAIQVGARQIECTINGIGERAGNCSLEEVVMAIHTRPDQFDHLPTRIKTREIYRTSQLVSNLCNMPIQPNKAIVGSNAFAHSSGIHQDGMLKAENTYEIMSPASVGVPTSQFNLTSRSGRHAVKHRMEQLGYLENDYDLDSLYADFLKLADRKGRVFDYDLEALVFFRGLNQDDDYYTLDYLNVQSGTNVVAAASIRLQMGDQLVCEAAIGNGPVDAAYQAINRVTGLDIEVIHYHLSSKGSGKDALGQVDIVVRHNNRHFHGMGLGTDIVESSAQAMIHALNHIHRANQITQGKSDKEKANSISETSTS
jgi:2-isopropylmalate synthase